jgi:hypothetical protein
VRADPIEIAWTALTIAALTGFAIALGFAIQDLRRLGPEIRNGRRRLGEEVVVFFAGLLTIQVFYFILAAYAVTTAARIPRTLSLSSLLGAQATAAALGVFLWWRRRT